MRYLLNQWMEFDQTCIDTFWKDRTNRLKFGDLDLIFKVMQGMKIILVS